VIDSTKLISITGNLGDTRTTITHPATTTHARITPKARAAAGITEGLIRLAVGLENAGDLRNDLARGLGKLGVTWSCNAKANVPYATLKIMKENGLRLLLVGYESGDDQILLNIKKGLRTDIARRFNEDCRKLGITIHGTFILGLPGETRDTIRKTIEYAMEINPHTIQVSLAAPYPGTRLYEQA
uniref:B12-binding domain-containing radical SAM protein n=1 Tax=Burkholderia cepacia TaxID=292 RepID=UPI001FC8A06E